MISVKKLRFSPKQAFYGICASIFVVLAGTGLLMYWANNQLEARKAQINEKRLSSQELDNKILSAQSLRQQLEEKQEITSVTSDVLPSSKSQEDIVGELLAIAAKRGLSLESISFDGGTATKSASPETSQAVAVKEIPGVYSLSIQTAIETDYENVLQFLEDVENNRRQFEVTTISISPTSSNPNTFTAQLTLVTYLQP